MSLNFHRFGATGWSAQLGQVRLHVDGEGDAPAPGPAALANRVAVALPELHRRAAAYLDLFVDRARACGDASEAWWLDEIEFRASEGVGPDCYAMLFTLAGDDDGLWTVTVRANDAGHRPFRLERLQG